MNAVDTNILIYEHDTRDPVKQNLAHALLTSLSNAALLWQVACEYLAASRKLAPFGYSKSNALADVRDMLKIWTPILPTWKVLDRQETLQAAFSLSHWDSLLIAACLEGGVTCLYSEDFDAYSRIQGLQIINPFRSASPSP